MAKTRKARELAKAEKTAKTNTRRGPAGAAPPPQGPEWTVEALTQALNATSVDEDIALLKRAGILTRGGKLAKRYTSWGDKVSRTPEINERGEMEG
ncbi:hypothetical protein WME75_16675 [Sorangium sp. So ce1014]|uniref:hypothetical protein n=1 Tax=Sorangium sp. So ce1014 TaxID=3133326 RepID=UPI003F5ED5CC